MSQSSDEIICEWCEKPGADDTAELLDGTVVCLHRFRCAASWAWQRAKERMQ